MKKFLAMWRMLSKPIYVGDRLKSNLLILTVISMVTALLGVILIVMNLSTGQYIMLIPTVVTFLASVGCGFCAGVLKKRELAGVFPLVFCAVAFTVYALTGLGQGSAILWSLLLPIGVSYFVSVRYGLVLSVYQTIVFFILFYTPLRAELSQYYNETFMQRFPLLFAFVSAFTIIAMVQYHRTALFEIEHTNRLNEEVAKQTRVATERALKLEHTNEEIVRTLAHIIDAKDKYTNGHSFRVSEYAVALARALGWSEERIKSLRRQALLHDIGKIGVPDAVLNKPGRLTAEEFAVIKSHTTIGGDILAESSELTEAAKTARYHHERYDGSGYPEGLAGEAIPENARLVAIADAYDAMRSDRIYRRGLPMEIIRGELIRGRGTQFDPEFLDVFLRLFDEGQLDAQRLSA